MGLENFGIAISQSPNFKIASMFKNYIIIGTRHFARHKLFAIINMLCLAIGITFSMVIGMYVFTQRDINSHLGDVDNQYMLKSIFKQKDLGLDITTISPLAKAAKEAYPSLVKNYYRYNPVSNVVSAGDKHFKENVAIGDTTLVSMYNFPVLYGDTHHAFASINSAVITKGFAEKLFGSANAIGKTLSLQTTVAGVTQDYVVSAVIKDIPYNTVTNLLKDDYNIFVPQTGSRYFTRTDLDLYSGWDNLSNISFLQLQPGIKSSNVAPLLNTLAKKNSSDFIWKNLSTAIVPVKDYYLNDNNEAVRKMMWILSLIAAFILLMVIINFININIGTSSNRLKEIGLRKTFGSARLQLIAQFIIESLILTIIAAFISLCLYQLLLPVFSRVLSAALPSLWQITIQQYGLLLLLVITTGILAGFYPAFVLSATNLVHAVKGKIGSSTGGLVLKRALLVIQFSLAIFVFICTINLSRQVTYIFNKDLGYDKEQLLIITAFPKQWDSAGVQRMDAVKQALLHLPGVKTAALTFDLPNDVPFGRIVVYPPKRADATSQVNLPVAVADEDYAKTFGIQMNAGSFFADDKNGFVINETAAKQLGLTAIEALGKKIATAANTSTTITGVMSDYNFSSLQDKIGPVGFVHMSSSNIYKYLIVKLTDNNVSHSIEMIKAAWRSFLPNAPFDYSFMDEKFAALYKAQTQLQQAANLATLLNIIIVLLGIVGVVSFMINKRNKEVAVRKVLGANAVNIILLFFKEYFVLIIVANIIAWPLAYLMTENLLQDFAYRVQQNIFSYIIVFAFIALLAFALIVLQCFKTAVSNPVESLRTE